MAQALSQGREGQTVSDLIDDLRAQYHGMTPATINRVTLFERYVRAIVAGDSDSGDSVRKMLGARDDESTIEAARRMRTALAEEKRKVRDLELTVAQSVAKSVHKP
jgi:hypothetical protein